MAQFLEYVVWNIERMNLWKCEKVRKIGNNGSGQKLSVSKLNEKQSFKFQSLKEMKVRVSIVTGRD